MERGLSQTGAAKLLDCGQSYVGLVEQGKRRPGLRIAFAIERVTEGAIKATEWAVEREAVR